MRGHPRIGSAAVHQVQRYHPDAVITGRPSALISALLKISGTMGRIPQRDLRAANSELAAFYIFPPRAKQTVASLFSTHPPLEKRIAALERLEAQLQGTAV